MRHITHRRLHKRDTGCRTQTPSPDFRRSAPRLCAMYLCSYSTTVYLQCAETSSNASVHHTYTSTLEMIQPLYPPPEREPHIKHHKDIRYSKLYGGNPCMPLYVEQHLFLFVRFCVYMLCVKMMRKNMGMRIGY